VDPVRRQKCDKPKKRGDSKSAEKVQLTSSIDADGSSLKDLMVQAPILSASDSSVSTVLSRQKSSFDIGRRHDFAEHGFAEIDRVEDRLAIVFTDRHE